MKFKITAEEWNGLDEGIRGLYKEQDGAYVLQVEGLPELPTPPAPADDTAGLKSALEKERTRAKELEKQLKSLGKTPEEITTILAEYQKQQDANKTEAEKLREAAARAEKEKADLATKIAELEASAKAKEIEALRIRIASEKGFQIELADRLRGETEEELRADADAMSAFFVPKTQETPNPTPQPKPVASPATPVATKTTGPVAIKDQYEEGLKRAQEINEASKKKETLLPSY
jgi:chromosome segregation ATPase